MRRRSYVTATQRSNERVAFYRSCEAINRNFYPHPLNTPRENVKPKITIYIQQRCNQMNVKFLFFLEIFFFYFIFKIDLNSQVGAILESIMH